MLFWLFLFFGFFQPFTVFSSDSKGICLKQCHSYYYSWWQYLHLEIFVLCLIYMYVMMYLEMSVICGYTPALSADKCTAHEIFLLYHKRADFKNYKNPINIPMVLSLRGCIIFMFCLLWGRSLDFLCSFLFVLWSVIDICCELRLSAV